MSIRRLVCLGLCLGVSGGFSQSIDLPDPPTIEPVYPPYPVLYVDGTTSHFAMLQQSASGQVVRRALMTEMYPKPEAKLLETMIETDGVTEYVYELYPSPDNRWLAVYVFEDLNLGFVDHNLLFFDFQSGEQIGLLNEHSFSGLNHRTHPLSVFEEFLDELFDGEAPAEAYEDFDYELEVEGANVGMPRYQWNEDGTFGIGFDLPIVAKQKDGGLEVTLGSQWFAAAASVSKDGVSVIDFDGERTAAKRGVIQYSFSPKNGPNGTVKINNEPIAFRSDLFWGDRVIPIYLYHQAFEVKGRIPLQYVIHRF